MSNKSIQQVILSDRPYLRFFLNTTPTTSQIIAVAAAASISSTARALSSGTSPAVMKVPATVSSRAMSERTRPHLLN